MPGPPPASDPDIQRYRAERDKRRTPTPHLANDPHASHYSLRTSVGTFARHPDPSPLQLAGMNRKMRCYYRTLRKAKRASAA